jgi:hypothetical protein
MLNCSNISNFQSDISNGKFYPYQNYQLVTFGYKK